MLDSCLCGLVKFLGGVLCRLPPSLCVGIGEALGTLGYWLQPKRVQVGVANLHAAFDDLEPGQARAIIKRLFQHLGAGVIEMLRLAAIDAAYVERYVRIEGQEHFEAAVASGRPVVVLAGHFGNWELLSIVSALRGYPVMAPARAQDQFPKLYALLVSFRESKGCTIVHKGGAMRKLFHALERRQVVGIVSDQADRQGLRVDFFGRPALFATGPFELAHLSGALILPGFVHRVRGPHHRLVIEPPIDLTREPGPKDAAVRRGIERFAAVLARHIAEDPAQWLWLYRRWKYTPARRAVILSDGKLGHVKQSRAVAQALKERYPATTERVIEVRYRHRPGRWLAVLWARFVPGGIGRWWCLRMALAPESFRAVACAYADVIISCGSSTAPVNRLIAPESRAKSVVIMNPAPLPLSAFDLAFVPAHDRVREGPRVVKTYGALGAVDPARVREARERLVSHTRFRAPAGNQLEQRPVVAVLLGGDTPDYRLTTEFAESLVQQVLLACESFDGLCLVTTSRRTAPDVERRLDQRLAGHPRCALLLLASRDPLNGTLEGMLGWARVVLVTGESISMVSEACGSGRPVVVVEPLRRKSVGGPTKAQRFLQTLTQQGYAQLIAADRVEDALTSAVSDPSTTKRLATDATIRDAVARFL